METFPAELAHMHGATTQSENVIVVSILTQPSDWVLQSAVSARSPVKRTLESLKLLGLEAIEIS